MINERNSVGVARYIKDSAQNNWDEWDYFEHEGVRVTHPYMGFQPVPVYQAPPPEMADSYSTMLTSLHTMDELFSTPLPSHWMTFLQEVDAKRKESGCEGPIDLISAIHYLAKENPKEANRIGIKPLELLPSGWPDLSNKESLANGIDAALTDKKTRDILKRELSIQIPNVGMIYGDIETLKEIVDALQLSRNGCIFPRRGLIVDLGCGTGERLDTLCRKFEMRGTGVDRQYHPNYYNHWQQPRKGVRFIQEDVRRRIWRIRSNSAGLVVIENVSHHVTTETLDQIIKQAHRILAPHGVLAIGPQSYEYKGLNQPSDNYWRFFVKTQNSRGEDMFIRKTLKQLKAAGATVEVK